MSVLATYPSYLGELVECGLEAGYGPADFGLLRILLGGEIATEGLKRRCRRLFGAVQLTETYGLTELVPFGATECADGHLHFQPTNGLLEIHDLESPGAAASEAPGSIVATPFPPLREATPLLRYDTEDVVTPLSEPLDCPMRGLPATTAMLGKSALSVRHDRGWTFPREVVEALESVEVVPLPARYGFSAAPGGVAVEVVARSAGRRVSGEIEAALESRGVPVRRLAAGAGGA